MVMVSLPTEFLLTVSHLDDALLGRLPRHLRES